MKSLELDTLHPTVLQEVADIWLHCYALPLRNAAEGILSLSSQKGWGKREGGSKEWLAN